MAFRQNGQPSRPNAEKLRKLTLVLVGTASKLLTGILFPVAWLLFIGAWFFISRPRLTLKLLVLAVAAFVTNWAVVGLALIAVHLLNPEHTNEPFQKGSKRQIA
jgi:hypothetical protein